jgi:SAM-dependent methyltransferase
VNTPAVDPFWESAEAVERFTGREPDVRLQELLDDFTDPGQVCVLDVGCAAGRNTVLLAERGFDVFAIDGSEAMVARTRERVAGVLGREESERRVQLGRMEDLSSFADASVHVLVALGVLHQAATESQWTGAIEEMKRCVAPGGRLLVAVWSPRSRPHGESVRLVAGEKHVYEGFHSGTHYLVEAPQLDSALASAGFVPVVPTREVVVENEKGWRVTINALYRRTQS